MSPLGISLLMLAAFAGFGYLAARKLRIVASLQPEVRWDHPGARLKRVFVHGLLQSRMIFGDLKAGLMHCVIFLGFVALLGRKLQLIVIGYAESFTYPGLAGGLFAGAKDVVEAAVLGAVGYAFWRRFVVRPARLESEPRGAADPVADRGDHGHRSACSTAFRFALLSGSDPGIAHERGFAVVGGALAGALAGWRRRHASRRLPRLLLGADADGVRVPRAPAGGRALPHRHGAARALLPPPGPRTACRPSTSSG